MSVSGLVGSLTIMAAAALISLGVFGLYAPEAFVCRPLLLRALAKASVMALCVSVVLAYFLRFPYLDESRSLLVGICFLPAA